MFNRSIRFLDQLFQMAKDDLSLLLWIAFQGLTRLHKTLSLGPIIDAQRGLHPIIRD